MFAELAPKLRDRGWQALIPIDAGEKSPAINGWQHFNRRPPTDEDIVRWVRIYRQGGIGLAFGPDRVVGVDLDIVNQPLADRAFLIAKAVLGRSPLIRVGQYPKRLVLYRAEPELVVDGKAFASFEIFSTAGQCLLYGIHPQTVRPYDWPRASPLDMSPSDLPSVNSEQVAELVAELSRIAPHPAPREGRARHSGAGNGHTTVILRALRDVEDPLAEAANILEGALHGTRHNTMVATVTALAMRGYSDRDIFDAIEPAFLGQMADQPFTDTARELKAAIDWARCRIGPSDEETFRAMGALHHRLAANWKKGWE